jgi:hypothetical protein
VAVGKGGREQAPEGPCRDTGTQRRAGGVGD